MASALYEKKTNLIDQEKRDRQKEKKKETHTPKWGKKLRKKKRNVDSASMWQTETT